jgi:uncharacterized damage-inducible protein DinB
MDALTLLRIQAYANAQANVRLHAAVSTLPPPEWTAPRTGFFPSLLATLNHILQVDLYYIAVLHGEGWVEAGWWGRFVPAATMPELSARQRDSDLKLVAWFEGATGASLDATVRMPRHGGRVQVDRAAHMLQHLFMHQTHHRGQAHAMLSGTAAAPPQLDEFLMPSEPHLRGPELAAFGWSEAQVYGPRAA